MFGSLPPSSSSRLTARSRSYPSNLSLSLSLSLSAMDQPLVVLLVVSLLAFQSKGSDADTSAFFIDSSTQNYLRKPSSTQTDCISLLDVGAAVSVLLGFAPTSSLSVAGSAKLNEILVPNPFDRPRAVFLLEVSGAEGSQLGANLDGNLFGNVIKSEVSVVDTQAHVDLPDEDVSIVSLNEDVECSDKEISDLVSWLGGSYVSDSLEPLNGELVIPMADGAHLRLHLTKNADREFATSLVSLIRNAQKVIANHQDDSQRVLTQAELISGKFDGLKALQEAYGKQGVAEQGLGLFIISVSKIFNSIQTAFKGHVAGVVVYTSESLPDSKNMLNVALASRASARSLEEKAKPPAAAIAMAEVELVRRSIAWITGILLIIATLMGIHFLLNMPLTRDTLLYSNVKLD